MRKIQFLRLIELVRGRDADDMSGAVVIPPQEARYDNVDSHHSSDTVARLVKYARLTRLAKALQTVRSRALLLAV